MAGDPTSQGLAADSEALSGDIEDLDSPAPAPARPHWTRALPLVFVAGLALLGLGSWWQGQSAVEQRQQVIRVTATALARDQAAATASATAAAQLPLVRRILSGTIALRTEARPPGLYQATAAGWVYLPGSTGDSWLMSRCGAGLLYTTSLDPGESTQEVALSGAGAPVVFRLPASASTLRSTCSNDLIIGWLDSENSGSHVRTIIRRPAAPQPAGVAQPFQPTLPDSTWAVAGVAPDDQRLLLTQSQQDAQSETTTTLYVAGATGANPRRLYSKAGFLWNHDWSADGRYLLVTWARAGEVADPGGVKSVMLFDTREDHASELLALGRVAALDSPSFSSLAGAGGQFRHSGPDAGRQVLAWETGDEPILRLFDPAKQDGAWMMRLFDPSITIPDPSIVTVALPKPVDRLDFLRETGDGGLLAGWQTAPTAPQPRGHLFWRNAGGLIRHLTVPLADRATLIAGWLRDDHLLYLVSDGDQYAENYTQTLYQVSLAAPDGTPAPIPLVTIPSDGRWADQAWRYWQIGDEGLAYLTAGGELHVRTFTSATDLLVESGVKALYAPDFH